MNIPNLLSLFRLALVPVFAVTYFSHIPYARQWAVLVYAVASFTDVLDGRIARKYNMTSNLGRILDPLGDKVMAFTVLVCITIDKLVPSWALFVFFSKELLMGAGGLVIHKKHKKIPSSNYLGKSATVIFFVVCVLLMLFESLTPEVATAMISVAVAITLIAFFSYIFVFIRSVTIKKISDD